MKKFLVTLISSGVLILAFYILFALNSFYGTEEILGNLALNYLLYFPIASLIPTCLLIYESLNEAVKNKKSFQWCFIMYFILLFVLIPAFSKGYYLSLEPGHWGEGSQGVELFSTLIIGGMELIKSFIVYFILLFIYFKYFQSKNY